MEKIKLHKERRFGEVIGDAFELIRQNMKLIFRSFLIIVMPLQVIASILLAVGFVGLTKRTASAYAGGHGSEVMQYIAILIGYVGSIFMAYMQSVVIHQIAIAYERTSEPQTLTAAHIWAMIKADRWNIVGTFFSSILFGVVFILIAAVLVFVGGMISASAAGFGMFIFYLLVIYVMVCMGNFMMLRLRDRYDLIAAFTTSITLTYGQWRWWRTLGILFVLMLIASCFFSASLIPYGAVAYIVRSHLSFITDYGASMKIMYTMMTVFILYANVVYTFLFNLVVLGLVVNYYSLMESKEHPGLAESISRIGAIDLTGKIQEGEY